MHRIGAGSAFLMRLPHRFVDDVAPLKNGEVLIAEYACVCGMRGTYTDIVRHIKNPSVELPELAPDYDTTLSRRTSPDDDNNNDFDLVVSGDTEVHYLPNEPRKPAAAPSCRSRGCLAPRNSAGTCAVHFIGTERESAPELPPPPSGPSQEYQFHKQPRSIAELFQDMLRAAFQAGAAATTTDESFETWYQREVLQ
jgi:hypothetical protein